MHTCISIIWAQAKADEKGKIQGTAYFILKGHG
jgi:hypothetical protein